LSLWVQLAVLGVGGLFVVSHCIFPNSAANLGSGGSQMGRRGEREGSFLGASPGLYSSH